MAYTQFHDAFFTKLGHLVAQMANTGYKTGFIWDLLNNTKCIIRDY